VADEIIDGLTPAGVEAWWRELIPDAAPHGRVIVACRDGAPVGMARIGPGEDDERCGHLYSLYVDPDWSGVGIGRALLERAAAELAADGYRRATLWVFAANERAIRLYRAAGWRPDGAQRVEPQWGAAESRLTITLGQRAQG
jgi:ribosomal protein S18 acetylase RimI-like enzyme